MAIVLVCCLSDCVVCGFGFCGSSASSFCLAFGFSILVCCFLG